jgi:hypothetical protein
MAIASSDRMVKSFWSKSFSAEARFEIGTEFDNTTIDSSSTPLVPRNDYKFGYNVSELAARVVFGVSRSRSAEQLRTIVLQ